MKEICVFRDYNIDDLASDITIKELLGKVDIADSNSVKLDLRDCFIDYPHTSRLMDYIFNKIVQTQGRKHLAIVYDLNAKEGTLLNWFFLESGFLDIKADEKSMTLDAIKKKISSKIKDHDITITIEVQYDEKSRIEKKYIYE